VLLGCGAVPVTVARVVGDAAQVPKESWHPASQWPVELPHHPYGEQQSPKEVPVQTYPFAPPQVPSGESLTVEVGLGAEVEDTGEGWMQVPNPVWQPSVAWQ
jgi:hypothetical protein